jgi:hypothetical protein
VGRRVEAQTGRAGREEVEVLRPADGAAVDGLDVDQARLAEPLEVQANGVGVEAETVGEVLGRQRLRRRRELLVHGVPRLVAERLQHREQLHRVLTVPVKGHIFKIDCVYTGPTVRIR